ncbi:lectin like domain-containing protein [Frisingicoccus caecimuris]|uniref:C1A family cysteine protease n=1 Tax=Frisingicoccus caecimuris TaxID=1796636 RepID=A0A4R2LAJ1_9FIRM|nr:lectin like domain-containing protein [Frisingicoccus caecimuris]MCR1919560.1 lectin like domain-containing protein [Frisingicoccus caecimuris]TCO83877.1 C1A family cysteine protease [Frisingicoccus caecimuris]
MKHVKRYFLLLAIICVTGIVLTRPQVRYLAGQASESLQSYYVSARADAVNEKGFTLSCNGTMLDIENMRMSSQMHLMMPLSAVVNHLRASVTVGENGQCFVQGQCFEDIAIITNTDDTLADRGPENIWIDMTEAASALGLVYQWNDETREASLDAAQSEELPRRYDLRENRVLNTVENQGTFGTCWAFASTAALETSQTNGEILDFSVDHMTMNSGFNIAPTEGGDYNMALAYLAAWKGPVLAADDPYGDGITDTSLGAVRHLQEARMIEEKDLNKIKSMIMRYGGVESSLYMSIQNAWDSSEDYEPMTASYYYAGNERPNHDIVIVGWDDDYSRENFNHMPENDGAFICRNSWGEDFGDAGYFYVSYEDSNLGTSNIVYTRLDKTDNYRMNYQSDMLGWVGTLGYKEPSAWFANVYTAGQDEVLRAVSFYATGGQTTYDIYAVPEYYGAESLEHPVYLGSGYCEDGGYYTVDIPEIVRLRAGSQFAVMVRITTEGSERPIAIEFAASELTSGADLSDGEGYISYDGSQWNSAEAEYGCNLCLKAFTD